IGLIRASMGGTLFLDEIGDLPVPAQTAFLRALSEREVLPVGATSPVPVDLRVVAASHRNLAELVAQGHFRADLFARVAGHTLELPPLRERREDLGILLAQWLKRARGEHASRIQFEPRAARALLQHDWPQNIRELGNALVSVLALATDGRVRLEHLPDGVRH